MGHIHIHIRHRPPQAYLIANCQLPITMPLCLISLLLGCDVSAEIPRPITTSLPITSSLATARIRYTYPLCLGQQPAACGFLTGPSAAVPALVLVMVVVQLQAFQRPPWGPYTGFAYVCWRGATWTCAVSLGSLSAPTFHT